MQIKSITSPLRHPISFKSNHVSPQIKTLQSNESQTQSTSKKKSDKFFAMSTSKMRSTIDANLPLNQTQFGRLNLKNKTR